MPVSENTKPNTTMSITDWLYNEGQASGDFENFLWAARPTNWREAKNLTETDRKKLKQFNRAELIAAIDEIEETEGFESSK